MTDQAVRHSRHCSEITLQLFGITAFANVESLPSSQILPPTPLMSISTHRVQSTSTTDGPEEFIVIRGARVHNLRNVDLAIPRNRLVVMTGPSGSGKSSLAFDTIYAEGQRQFIESLSVYARQFLNQMERPDVDLIQGLQPTLCIDQRPGNQNPRSTVATVTEIYDYLRLLMARLGQPACYQCGQSIRQQTGEQIREQLLGLPDGTKLMLLAPLVRGRRGAHQEVLAQIRRSGFVRARVDQEVYELEEVPDLAPRRVHHIEAVVDRIVIREGVASRLGESIQLALHHGEGLVIACYHTGEQSSQRTLTNGWQEELFSTVYACPTCQVSYEELEPRTFSFNSPYGACPDCDGLGVCEEFDPDLVIPNPDLSLADGALAPWKGATTAAANQLQSALQELVEREDLPQAKPLRELPTKLYDKLLQGDRQSKFPGVLGLLEREFATTTKKPRLEQLANFRANVTCRSCSGSRLRPEASSVRLADKSIHQISQMSVGAAADFFRSIDFSKRDQPVGRPLVREICRRLEFLDKVGVDYLTLDRAADTLSGGELQRVRLATSIGSGLVGVCYVLDEPSIGLHQRDNQRLIDAMRDLQQQGNTVIVVEHDEATMRQADQLIDLGPSAGVNGGRIVGQGTPRELDEQPESITGRYLSRRLRIEVPSVRRRVAKSRALVLEGATQNNLQGERAEFPLSCLVCVTGVSGSGKSSLVNETLFRALIRRLGGVAPKPGSYSSLRGGAQLDKVIQIDQSPIGRTPRSNPATYTGLFDEIRKVFASTRDAKQRGYRVGRFSFNAKHGRCEDCQGHGVRKIEMNFLPDLYVTCSQCGGARFNRQTLQVRYRGKSIADVLAMAIEEAVAFFENFALLHRTLQCLVDVGLGYLPLGQPSTTLSGGEAQRIKLATQLARVDTGKTLYLLDEPTTGLHFDDVRRLLDVLNRLVNRGNTVIVIEHNLDVIKCADWILDLGPEGGQGGGHIVATGTPEQIAKLEDNHTGRFLKPLLE